MGVPDAPGEPRPFRLSEEVGTVKMSWAPPADDGGSPILYYVVREEKKGITQRCDTNICVFRKLENGGNYNFRVRAVNRVGESAWSDLSRSAQADTAPGRVQNIRMVERGDGTITFAWDKPTTNTSRILRYTVSWAGVPAPIEVPGERTRFTATGLDNNARYVFQVKAENQVDFSLPRDSEEMQSLGTPLSPPAPAVTDLEAGANQTSIRIAWQGVLPEGPGPTAYTVTYSNGATGGAVSGCQKLVALTCTHTNVPYDGLSYTYRVVASNQPGNRSAPSEGTLIQAVGRPAAWGAFQLSATGANQEAEVQYTVPDSRGSTSRVDILVGGVAVKTFSRQTGSQATRISVPDNEQAHGVQLRVCNEDAPAGCTLSGTQSVQTFGPLQSTHIATVQPVADGQSLSWVITGTSNGRPATLTVSSDERNQTFQVPAGSWSVQTQSLNLGWRESERLTASLADPANGRGPVTRTADASTGSPPDPELVIFRSGDRCSTAADRPSDVPDCRARGWDGEDCTFSNCAFIQFSVRGFLSRYTCTIQRSGFGRSDIGFAVDPVQAAGGNSFYYGGLIDTRVAITCNTPDYKTGQGNYQGGGSGWVNW